MARGAGAGVEKTSRAEDVDGTGASAAAESKLQQARGKEGVSGVPLES
jgi:hypothetical protein